MGIIGIDYQRSRSVQDEVGFAEQGSVRLVFTVFEGIGFTVA